MVIKILILINLMFASQFQFQADGELLEYKEEGII